MNGRHVKVIGQLHSKRPKQEMTTTTHNMDQVNKLTSHLTLTKSKSVKQKELFHSAKVACRQVVQEAASQKEELESDINYLNAWLMEISEEVKCANCMENDYVWKASKSSLTIYNRLQRFKYLNLLIGELKAEITDEYHPLRNSSENQYYLLANKA